MFAKVLRSLLMVGYVGVLMVAFTLSSYLSFNTFVRRGELTVPDLVGLALDEAEVLVADDGLSVQWREGRHRFDPNVRPGGISQQKPPAGSLVKRGSAIDVTLSLGRQLVEVPDLSGQTLQTAQVNLSAAGLSLGRLTKIYSPEGDEERVVRQRPAPGSTVDHLSRVDLFLCLENSSRSFVMPDLVYERYDRVRRFFEAQGFRVGSVKYEPYEGIKPGVVLRQFPLAGHRLLPRDVISLVVASRVEPTSREVWR